jgi:hypothetical protein
LPTKVSSSCHDLKSVHYTDDTRSNSTVYTLLDPKSSIVQLSYLQRTCHENSGQSNLLGRRHRQGRNGEKRNHKDIYISAEIQDTLSFIKLVDQVETGDSVLYRYPQPEDGSVDNNADKHADPYGIFDFLLRREKTVVHPQ